VNADEIAGLIECINALEKKATPGPWERDCERLYSHSERKHYIEHFVCSDQRGRIATCAHVDAQQVDNPDGEGLFEDLQARHDLEFVAALRNAWPQIAQALSSLAEARKDAVTNAVAAIISDLSDRGGLGNKWDEIDEDLQVEIAATWEELIRAALSRDEGGRG
jgi:hypothetical protein